MFAQMADDMEEVQAHLVYEWQCPHCRNGVSQEEDPSGSGHVW